MPLHFTERIAWQGSDEADVLWLLVAGELVAAEDDDCLRGEGRIGTDDDGGDGLTELRVRHADPYDYAG